MRFRLSKRALFQIVVFLLLATNIELFAWYRLVAEGFEVDTNWSSRDVHSSMRFRANLRDENYLGTLVCTNADGLRSGEILGPPGPNEFRIMCLGDSLTFGTGLDVQHTYPWILQQVLQKEAPPGMTINVVNAGQPGYAAYRAAGLLEALYDTYRPQLVTAMFGYNDSQCKFIHDSASSQRLDWLRGVLYKSHTYRYLTWRLKSSYEPVVGDGGQRYYAKGLDWVNVSAANLLVISEYARAHDVKYMVFAEAKRRNWTDDRMADYAPDQATYERLKATYSDMGKRNDVPVYIMDEAFDATGLSEPELFQPNPVHTTPLGSKVIAETMARELWRLHLVPHR